MRARELRTRQAWCHEHPNTTFAIENSEDQFSQSLLTYSLEDLTYPEELNERYPRESSPVVEVGRVAETASGREDIFNQAVQTGRIIR